MGTRYVWGQYGVNRSYQKTTTSTTKAILGSGSITVYYTRDAVSFNEDTRKFSMSGSGDSDLSPGYDHEWSSDIYLGVDASRSSLNMYFDSGDRDYDANKIWHAEYSGNTCHLTRTENGSVKSFSQIASKQVSSKGSLVGDIFSASSGAYPQDGVQGSYWYTYQGSDNIDPASVSIPAAIMPNQEITITVTPGSGKVYGGMVSYQYQVKLDSGAWQMVATTTATTQIYTVPAGTQSIQARVVASDNMGFTSDTYVASAAVTVVGTPASITVPGAAMPGQSIQVSWSSVDTGGES